MAAPTFSEKNVKKLKWPLTVQLITLTIKGHFMKLLGSVICITSLSTVYGLSSVVMLPYGILIWLTSQFLYERKIWKVFKKKCSSLCFYNTIHSAIFKTQYCINSQMGTCSKCENRLKWRKWCWQAAKDGVIMTKTWGTRRSAPFSYCKIIFFFQRPILNTMMEITMPRLQETIRELNRAMGWPWGNSGVRVR